MDVNSTQDQPLVDYTLVVTDSVTQAPLVSVRIDLRTIAGDTSSYLLELPNGRITLATVASSRTEFHLSKPGYRDLDFVDTIASARDTVFNRPLSRILNLKMAPAGFGQVGLKPLLKDTLAPGDTLVFLFERPVARIEKAVVRLTNLSGELWTERWLDSSRKTLKMVQKDADWQRGKQYDYELVLRDDQGNILRSPADSAPAIRGSFVIRGFESEDTTLVYPLQPRLVLFNSGSFSRFDSLHLDTSPHPDSTTRFARLRWNWPTGSGKRADSILVLFKDGSAAAPDWTLFTSIPGSADSATLDFAEKYSTANLKSQRPFFPLLEDSKAEIQLRLVAKHGDRHMDAFDTTLATLRQGMGPRLYAVYEDRRLNDLVDAKDSIRVHFLTNPKDSLSKFDFGPDYTTEPILPSIPGANVILNWDWVDRKTGLIQYSFTGNTPAGAVFRADMTGKLFEGKPIWMWNRYDGAKFK